MWIAFLIYGSRWLVLEQPTVPTIYDFRSPLGQCFERPAPRWNEATAATRDELALSGLGCSPHLYSSIDYLMRLFPHLAQKDFG